MTVVSFCFARDCTGFFRLFRLLRSVSIFALSNAEILNVGMPLTVLQLTQIDHFAHFG